MHFGHILGQRKIHLLGIIASVIVILRLFGTWLWRGFKPYPMFDTQTGKRKSHYHVKTTLSPFFFSIIRDGKVESTIWFIDFETFLVGLGFEILPP